MEKTKTRLCVGGGIAIYTREDLNGKRRRDLGSHRTENNCALTLPQLKQHRCAPLVLSCLYRPPKTIDFL